MWDALQKIIDLWPKADHPAHHHERILPEAVKNDSIMLSQSLIPQAMFHAFATFGSLMDPALSLTRCQHEIIVTTVSTLNKCFY